MFLGQPFPEECAMTEFNVKRVFIGSKAPDREDGLFDMKVTNFVLGQGSATLASVMEAMFSVSFDKAKKDKPSGEPKKEMAVSKPPPPPKEKKVKIVTPSETITVPAGTPVTLQVNASSPVPPKKEGEAAKPVLTQAQFTKVLASSIKNKKFKVISDMSKKVRNAHLVAWVDAGETDAEKEKRRAVRKEVFEAVKAHKAATAQEGKSS
jgi:hypothetical protein